MKNTIMKITEVSTEKINVPGIKNAFFPGFADNSNGELILLCQAGSAFESSDCQGFYFKSADKGKSWEFKGGITDFGSLGFEHRFTAGCKPTLLPDGKMIAAGYGYVRDRPDMGLSDYFETFKHFPDVHDFVVFSEDAGNSWSAPELIKHNYFGLEFSGPAVVCADGSIIAFGPPFDPNAAEQKQVILASTDGGKSWTERASFSTGDIAPWECRAVVLADGTVVMVIWAFDTKKSVHLNTQLIISKDNGKSWSGMIDTGLRAQACNLLMIDGKLAILQARREGEKAGLYLNFVELTDDNVIVGEDYCLWLPVAGANVAGGIEKQFAALKFGQPSARMVDEKTMMVCFWGCVDDLYSVYIKHFEISK